MFEDIDPFTASPAELLACVIDLEPGLFVASLLASIDRAALNGDEAITFLQIHERVTAWWASIQADVLVAAAAPERMVEQFTILDPRPGHDEERTIRIEDAVREEVAAAVRWSPSTAQQRIDTARILAGPLATTKAALTLGEITTGHVHAIVEAASRLPNRYADSEPERQQYLAACTDLQRRVLPVARRGTLSATRAAAKRAVLVIDAEGERQRRERARCTRDVYVMDDLDGISTLIARMGTVDAHAVMSFLDARATEGGSGLVGERRVDALVDLVLAGPQRAEPLVQPAFG